jgi:hypothetical protein
MAMTNLKVKTIMSRGAAVGRVGLRASVSLWLILLCAMPSWAAQTLAQRGLITQSYGVQNAGAPGDLGTVEFGSYIRRPYGPRLAGWSKGWSAHNSNALTNQFFTLAGASTTKGLVGGWFYFGTGTRGGSNGIIEPIRMVTTNGGDEVESLQLHVDTMALDLVSLNAFFTTSSGLKTVPNHKWVFLALSYENTSATLWTMKVLYREVGGPDQILVTKTGYNMGVRTMAQGHVGTRWSNGATIPARIGLPSVYAIDAVASDTSYPTDIIEPAVAANTWYVSSAAVGGGEGDSEAGAWTPAELVAETGATSYTVTSGEVLNPTDGSIVDTTAIDADVLKARYAVGTAQPGGNIVYFNDTAGPIRFASTLQMTLCGGVRLLPLPSLARRVEIRGCTRLTSWASLGSNVWEASLTSAYPVLFEFDSAAEADSRTGKARWLTHPGAITTSGGFIAAATDGSFGTDGGGGTGTKIWVRTTGSGNPNSNGKVYEATTTNNLLIFSCTHGMAKDLIIRFGAAVGTNNTGADASVGDCVKFDGNGMLVIDNCDLRYGGKHIYASAESGIALKQRTIIVNNTMNEARPGVYCGSGGQTLTVQDNDTNGRDNQWYYENISCTVNAGAVGSTAGSIDVSQPGMYEHGLTGGTHPFSKGFAVNNNVVSASTLGVFTSTATITGNVFGSTGASNQFGGTSLTMKVNKITGLALPVLGEAGATSNLRNNLFIATGAIGTTATMLGTVNFQGNTIDATAATGGTTKALWTRGGVLTLNFSGNVVLFNNSDLYRLFDTITPASGDSLTMVTNQLQGTDVNRILVTAYAGATTKTLAQLVAGGQDSGSAWTASLVLDANYKPRFDSAVRGFVNLATVTGLQNTSDWRGRARGSAGTSEAGGLLYAPPVEDFRIATDVGIGN